MNWIPELPLLRRELTELANRRRTYLVRVIGAVVILLLVFISYNRAVEARLSMGGRGTGITAYLGVGGEVFGQMVPTLFYAVQLLMPAFCCACITSEKESNTIGTLLLTQLSPATIIVEKFLSRLVPMLTLVLLTFPMLAYVLTLGGVDTNMLIGTLWLLFCECFLIASIAILCSSFFATTVAAFTMSYCIIGILAVMLWSLQINTFVPSAIWLNTYGLALDRMRAMIARTQMLGNTEPSSVLLTIVAKSTLSLIVTFLCLLVARLVLVWRAFPTHSSVLLKVFRGIDTFFKQLNDRTTGGIVLLNDRNPLPEDRPVVWREQYKKSLGKARYLIRVLLVLEGPTLFICMTAATLSAQGAFFGLYVLQIFIWILAVLIAAVKGATLFSSERGQQTLEPLLATPMSSVDILNQKISGTQRLLIVLAVPILTVNFTQFILQGDGIGFLKLKPLLYALLSVVNTYVLLLLVTWVAAGIGLKIHSQTKAVLSSVTVIGMWIALPLAVVFAWKFDQHTSHAIGAASPLSPVYFSEYFLREHGDKTNRNGEWVAPDPRVWALFTCGLYIVMLVIVRIVIRSLAPRLLGRRDKNVPPPHVPEIEPMLSLERTSV